jgi:3D (Asp-Asp-Asp) domain-containing protein
LKISTVLGSALGVLLVFSVISYAQDFVRAQDPKPATQQKLALEVPGQTPQTDGNADSTQASRAGVSDGLRASEVIVPAQTYSATAYSLRGRTASGQYVTRGLIAADPRVLPLGTRVRLEAGQWSGEYLVADTGGAIRGRKIDIWTPSTREAMQFGRRPVKLTVLSYPKRSATATRARVVNPPTAPAATAEVTTKLQK